MKAEDPIAGKIKPMTKQKTDPMSHKQ